MERMTKELVSDGELLNKTGEGEVYWGGGRAGAHLHIGCHLSGIPDHLLCLHIVCRIAIRIKSPHKVPCACTRQQHTITQLP